MIKKGYYEAQEQCRSRNSEHKVSRRVNLEQLSNLHHSRLGHIGVVWARSHANHARARSLQNNTEAITRKFCTWCPKSPAYLQAQLQGHQKKVEVLNRCRSPGNNGHPTPSCRLCPPLTLYTELARANLPCTASHNPTRGATRTATAFMPTLFIVMAP